MAIDLSATPTPPNANPTAAEALQINSALNAAVQRSSTDVGHAIIGGDLTGNVRGFGAIDIQSVRLLGTTVASGEESIAYGYNNTASGKNSSAVGYNNTASGVYSSAVGHSNNASWYVSSAVGHSNTASGQNSSAVGYNNTASGYNSSAVGYNNTASWYNSSAFGYNNTASGYVSCAFGFGNTASGYVSCAFGFGNTAGENGSSAFGYSNTASGYNSSAVGRGNTASGNGSSAFGYSNTASGYNSSAVGYNNTASGYNSSAVGTNNTVSGSSSSAFGYYTKTHINETVELGFWSSAESRSACLRLHGDKTFSLPARNGVLINGNPTVTITSLTRSGATATATSVSHNLITGQEVFISGSNQAEYNGKWKITVTSSSQFTFGPIGGLPDTPATGTITAKTADGSEKNGSIPIDTFTIRRNGLEFFLTYNDAGTIRSIPLGTVS
jgi:Head domain of trimeric autotransporter adhesin